MKQGLKRFFAYARARHECYLMKQSDPDWETKDPILWKYRFTNVFRENDKTTAWFRENVRDPMNKEQYPGILLATVAFRLLNRIQTGEAMFCDDDLLGGHSAFNKFAETGDTRPMVKAIKARCGRGPYVTGGYIISSPPGYSKLDGMMEVIKRFYKGQHEWEGLGAGVHDTMGWGGEEGVTTMLTHGRGEFTLEDTWKWLSKFDYLGKFHSYEIVSDLRWTYLLDKAPDIMTWANPGPGCKRGANRVLGRDKDDQRITREEIIELMQVVLLESKDSANWAFKRMDHKPKEGKKFWPDWEMRDVEHTFCEFDKYERVRNGEGKPRGKYR